MLFLFFYALGEIIQLLYKTSKCSREMLLVMLNGAAKRDADEGNYDKLAKELRNPKK